MHLDNRVAVITGAGSGIGAALAVEAARRGCDLALSDIDVERLEPVAAEARTHGRRVSTHGLDVAQRDAWQPFHDDVLTEHGRANLLINNAGVSLSAKFEDMSLEQAEWIVGINLWGVWYGMHTFLPTLLEQPAGHIVNLSSVFGIMGIPTQTAYCATKFAVRGLTEALSIELEGTSVGVTSVHPGGIATRIAQDARYAGVTADEERRAKKMISKGMKPEQAAQIILDGVERDKRRVLVGRDAAIMDLVARVAPTRYRDVVRRVTDKMSERSTS